jgi:hypothetical protein
MERGTYLIHHRAIHKPGFHNKITKNKEPHQGDRNYIITSPLTSPHLPWEMKFHKIYGSLIFPTMSPTTTTGFSTIVWLAE